MSYDPTQAGNVGAGWQALLAPVLACAARKGLALHQIKEKFGILRVYADSDPELDEAIRVAEAASAAVCEDCGAPGTGTSDRRWRKTLCAACKAVRGRT